MEDLESRITQALSQLSIPNSPRIVQRMAEELLLWCETRKNPDYHITDKRIALIARRIRREEIKESMKFVKEALKETLRKRIKSKKVFDMLDKWYS